MRITVELTNKCDLACKHCFSGRHGGHDELPLEILEDVLEDARSLNFKHLSFTGGEPSLYSHLTYLLGRLSHYDYRFSFVTNGQTFEDFYPKLQPYLANLEHIIFSLDGATARTHGALRGRGTFEKLISAMKRCKDNSVPFTHRVTLARHNVHQLKALCDLSLKSGSRGLRFAHLMPSPHTTVKGFDLTLEERKDVEQSITKLSGEYQGRLAISLATGSCTTELVPCAPLHMQEVNIDVSGRLTKCKNLSSHGAGTGSADVAGDLRYTSFKEAFLRLLLQNSRFVRAKRAKFQKGEFTEGDKNPCWYCANHFKKLGWLKHFEDASWHEYLWEEKPKQTSS